MKIVTTLMAAATMAMTPVWAFAGDWSGWSLADGNLSAVHLHYRYRYNNSGDTEIQWKITNKSNDRIDASVRNKVYTYGNGDTTSASNEGSIISPWSHETFMPDHIKGEVRRFEAEVSYR